MDNANERRRRGGEEKKGKEENGRRKVDKANVVRRGKEKPGWELKVNDKK